MMAADLSPGAGVRAELAAAALALLLPPRVTVAGFDLRDDPPPPLPGEDPGRAVPRRQREFAGGRAAVRRALALMGQPPVAVPVGPGRAPVWPAGVVGSLTHTGPVCLAAVAPAPGFHAIGIDAEPDAPMLADLLPAVCRAEERAWLTARSDGLRLARAVFAAKEAAFKAQFPLTGAWLAFTEALVTLDFAAGSFTLRFCRPTGPFAEGAELPGRFAFRGGLVLAAVAIARDGALPLGPAAL